MRIVLIVCVVVWLLAAAIAALPTMAASPGRLPLYLLAAVALLVAAFCWLLALAPARRPQAQEAHADSVHRERRIASLAMMAGLSAIISLIAVYQ